MARSGKLMLASALLVLLGAALSLCLGASGVSTGEMLSAVLNRDTASVAWRVFAYVRLPRTIAAALAGSALATAGLLLQAVLRNPLAAPSIIGVNAGAGLCALIAMAVFPALGAMVSPAAFLGACLAVFLVYALARLTDASRTTIVLSGVAVNALLGACMDAIVTLIPDAAVSRSAFAIGGFSGVTMDQLRFAAPFWAVGLLIALLFQRELELMGLGDEVAQSLGMRVERFRVAFLAAAALLAGSAVSFAGLIGFVGLITPHLTEQLAHGDTRFRVPIAALSGAALCLFCDLIARTLFAPYELPVGIVLSFLGAPFFLHLLIHRKRSNRHAAD